MHEPASVTGRLITADFLTSGYRIVDQIMVPRSGLMGLMNDVTSNFMEVQDAKLARLHMPTKLVGEYKLIDLVKPNIFAVCLARREETAHRRWRGGYQNLIKYPIRVTTQVYELEGTLEWAGRFDFSTVIVEGTRDFVPLYDTTLTAILIPGLRIESPAVLFNRKQVDILALLSDRKES